MIEKTWQCYNQCKSNCCSELFFKVSPEQLAEFKQTRKFTARKNYTNWRWLSYHEKVKITKFPNSDREIYVEGFARVLFSEPANSYIIHVLDPCNKLLPDGRCKIYRARPDICKYAKCPVFDNSKEIQWIAENGTLKKQIEAYRQGKLTKW